MKSDAWLHRSHWSMLATSLHQAGVRRLVLCPGSRSAPLTLSLVRSDRFDYAVSVDERSAGFVALGMALRHQEPVAVVCTSGTALLNLGPAVAEAFFQRIPLVVLSADRPLGSVGHQRGQVIHQNGVFGAHVQGSLCWVNQDNSTEALQASCDALQAILYTACYQKGPVHINVPFQEPLYDLPAALPKRSLESDLSSQELLTIPTDFPNLPNDLKDAWNSALVRHQKIWLLAGMGTPDSELDRILEQLLEQNTACQLWREDLSNLRSGRRINEMAWNLALPEPPDLLISWGGPLVSKALGRCLALNPRLLHWRIDPRGDLIDTYHRLDGVWDMQPLRALQALHELPPPFSSDDVQGDDGMDDQPQHQLLEQQIQENYKQLPYSDSWAMNALKPHLQGARVHLGNSSLVRKFLALPSIPGTPAFVHCNRGTSGIEGNVSTALGDALVSKGSEEVWLLNGDLATAYDAGAWLVEPRPLLRVVLFNNQGGDIFRQIPGSSTQAECETLFATPRPIHWESWCTGYGLPWRRVDSKENWEAGLAWLKAQEQSAVLEVSTLVEANREAERLLRPNQP